MILALIWLLVVAVAAYLIARFFATILAGQGVTPPWLPQAIYLIAALIVLFYFATRTLPVILHSIP